MSGGKFRYTFFLGLLGFFLVCGGGFLFGGKIVVPDDFGTIAEAVAAASDYDLVLVRAGTYYNETIIVDKPLTIAGEDRETTIINNLDLDLPIYPFGESVFIVEASHVTIRDMTIQGGWDGIKSVTSSVGDLHIDNVVFWRNGYAFYGRYLGGNVLIENCLFNLNEFCGVLLRDSWGCVVRRNELTPYIDNAIRIWDSSACEIVDNKIGSFMYTTLSIVNCSGIHVKRNEIETNEYGLYLGLELQDVVVSDNVFWTNGGGYHGFSLYNVTGDPKIFHNDILGYYFVPVDMIISDDFSAVGWDDGYPSGGNYWAEYGGVDADGDGIGDTPHTIVCSSGPPHPEDIYPLMKPFRSGIEANIKVKPEKVNGNTNGKYVNAYIELPEGYNVADIDLSTVQANKCVACEPDPVKIKDFNNNGIPDLKVKFSRRALKEAIRDEMSPCEIKISGDVNGEQFVGFCYVKVK